MFENLAEKLIFVVFSSFCAGFARADEACPDGLCAVPQGEPNGSFPVLSPLPQSAVDVGWKPYHMQQGYGLNESTLSCASAINWGNNLVPASSDPETCPLSAQEKLLGETEMAEETETPPWLAWTGTATASGRGDVTTTPGPRWR